MIVGDLTVSSPSSSVAKPDDSAESRSESSKLIFRIDLVRLSNSARRLLSRL